MRISLLGKDCKVVVDQRDNWGESEFTLTLKKSRQGRAKLSFQNDFGDEPDEDFEQEPFPRQKVGRNDPCPCGSGKKFKMLPWQGATPAAARNRTKFPIGTIALYGPDDKRTTKIVAGVIKREGADAIIERWVGTNVQDNPKVKREIQEFFKKHGVKSVVATDRNMGCPHEEGEDFPDGGDCPFCPWWKGKQGSGAKE